MSELVQLGAFILSVGVIVGTAAWKLGREIGAVRSDVKNIMDNHLPSIKERLNALERAVRGE